MDGPVRVGVDVGGTFTDVVVVRGGETAVYKTASTPAAPERGVLDGLAAAVRDGSDDADDGAADDGDADSGVPPGAVEFLAHGTTVATNALLERDWADAALVTTEGFEDALEIGRQTRPALYDLAAERPAPVVERDRRFGVPERLDERGRVVTPLDEAAVRDVADRIRATGVESVAVSLLFAFENDAHERRVGELLAGELDDVVVSLSSDVLPEIREHERTLATALNAALRPVMDDYVGALETGIDRMGVPAGLGIMQSNGGTIDAAAARERPVDTLLSGPAAGVQGAAHVAERAGMDDVVTMDMGGTSCDVSVVRDGEPAVSTELSVGDYPVAVPAVDVHTIGAGGGSIAWVDDGGALRVGPRSAGADPGPVCYGRGGTEPTVTDAHLVLGRIGPDVRFADGTADLGAVRSSIARAVADPLGMDVETAARGILDVANANMERALRVVSVERGHDPRAFGLVAYGGAGPLHACRLAEKLGVARVLVPPTAGVLSALGLLVGDVVYEYGSSMVRPWADVDPDALAEAFGEFRGRGRERLADEGFAPGARRFERALDLRYRGQSFDLRVPVPDGPLDRAALGTVLERFHRRHEDRYGHASPDEPVELVAVRLRAVGAVDPPALAPAAEGAPASPVDERPVAFGGGKSSTPVYRREDLTPATSLEGPALVEAAESTAVVHPGQSTTVDDRGNLVVETGGTDDSRGQAGEPEREG